MRGRSARTPAAKLARPGSLRKPLHGGTPCRLTRGSSPRPAGAVRGYARRVSAWLVAAALALHAAAARRFGLASWEGVALALCAALAAAAVGAMGLAAAGVLRPGPLGVTWLAAAALLLAVPRTRRPLRAPVSARVHLALGLVVLAGFALRLPAMTFPMGGRDQGTYLLRARHTARTGRLDATDRVLARLGAAPAEGDADVTGLFRVGHEPWRENRYEGPYRPGWYLADLDTGHVVPQFFHLQPSLLASGELTFGPGRGHLWILAQAAAGLLAFAALTLAVLPGPIAVATAGLYALSPMAIWTGRQTLTEPFAALLLLAAAICALRGERGAVATAAFVGTLAFLRGDGWIAAGVLLAAWALAALARVARAAERRAAVGLAMAWVGSVALHAHTAYPYVHDELARQLGLHPSPLDLSAGAAGVAGLLLLPLLLRSLPGPVSSLAAGLLARPMAVAGGLGLVALALYLAPVGEGRASRLDPAPAALGAPLLLAAVAGAARRARGGWRVAPAAWALVLLVPLTLILYAPKNLPRAHLYYYGRYLVPVLLPAALLLAADLAVRLARAVPGGRGKALAGAVLLACAWPSRALLTAPQTRLRAFEGAETAMATLAAAIPEDAVVIAGGEGWHGGHTFNQIGGGLAFGYGRIVLPYVNDGAAYGAAVHLLVTRPMATGEPPPRVFLLRNEATHARPDPRRPGAGELAVFDDRLPPPLRAVDTRLFEVVLHRLTPTAGALPTRVTRDALRLGLVELAADPAGSIPTWTFADGRARGPAPLRVRTFAGHRAEGLCLRPDRDTVIALPELPEVRAVTLTVTPGVAERAGRIRLWVDGRRAPLDPPGAPPRPRATLGPVAAHMGSRLTLRGAPEPTPGAPCPHGGVARLSLLGPSRRASVAAAQSERLGVRDDLGVPIPTTTWVPGRGLSRARPVRTDAARAGLSFLLAPGAYVDFGPQELPADTGPLALSPTLVRSEAEDGARLEVLAGDHVVASFTPPRDRRGTWLAPPVTWTPDGPIPTLRVRLVGGGPDTRVWLRDLAIYAPP